MMEKHSPMEVMTLLGVQFAYDGQSPVLKGIDVSVQRGAIHVLLGPNATGKTTLLKLMLGM